MSSCFNIVVVQSLICVRLCNLMDCSMPGFPVLPISWSLLKLMSIESVIPSNHLISVTPSPPAFYLSQHKVFPNESALGIRWPKYWSFSFSISPHEDSRLISFRIDWFDLLGVQGTLIRR